jgi:transglutaminase-like putative cysteine protease
MYQRALALAPEDLVSLRALSDLYGEEDRRDEQLALLRQILAISPQAKDVREYVEHIEPPRPRADEAYAWGQDRFLPMRTLPPTGHKRRTLRNLTVTTVFPNGLASRFRQVVFQPLTDEAAAAAREYAFEYQGERQTVVLRAAKVYRADGKVDEAIESGEGSAHNPELSMYTSQRTFYVHFPRLAAGDVVELRYRVEDVAPRNEIADYFGEVEYLQSDEPTASSEYVLVAPKGKALHTFASPLPGLVREVKDDGDRTIHRFAATDVAAAVPEPAMPPWGETLAHVHVSTFKTWDEVGSWYWGLVREQFDVDDEVRRVAREITKGLKDDREKVRAIYKYATRTRYVALEFGIEGIRPRRTAQTVARGWGDCKDKATLIVTLLREVGIPSTIVLVRTRLRGEIEPEPASLAPFDHAIAYVPSLDLYLDGTADHTGSAELPAMDRGAFALQVNEGKPKLVRLPVPSAEESVLKRRVEATVAADGSAQFVADTTVSGAFAAQWRQRYLAEAARGERATRDLSEDLGPVELAGGKAAVEVNDLEDVEAPVHLRAKGRAPTFGRREADAVSLPVGPAGRLVADLAALSTRNHDVALRALTTRDEEWTLKLPPGAKVQALPQAVELDSPFGRFSVKVEHAGGKVVVRSTLALKKARVPVGEYAAFRAFCEAADRAFGQRVVVGK